MINNILVPVDRSSSAEIGVSFGIDIARRCGAQVHLVHYAPHADDAGFLVTGDVQLRDTDAERWNLEYLRAMREYLSQFTLQHTDITIHIHLVDSDFKQGVDDFLSEHTIDLIVIGTSDEDADTEVKAGTHTRQVIRKAACPVISVRSGYDPARFGDLVVGASVLQDNTFADALAGVRDIASCFDARVHLVHVRTSDSDDPAMLEAYFKQIAVIAKLEKYVVAILPEQDAVEGILAYAHEMQAGLVAVIKSRREGIFRMFAHRPSVEILKEEQGPVMTINLRPGS